jgi:hypothetical protein
MTFEAHLPTDLLAERPSLLFGDPPGDGAGGYTARLQQDYGTVAAERWRNAGGLAGSGWGDDDHATAAANRGGNCGEMIIQPEAVSLAQGRL